MIEALSLVVLGLVAGALAAALGIGGGIIFVPAFVTFFGLSQLVPQGTSLAIIVPTAIIATIGHARADRVDWRAFAIVGPAGIAGALVGSRVAFSLDEALLQRIFGVLLLILAFRMAWRAWRLWPGSAPDGRPDAAITEE